MTVQEVWFASVLKSNRKIATILQKEEFRIVAKAVKPSQIPD